ncbi:hypothetical protein [Scytonema hofmannii]|uniref:hypothetical protein n=1 Tax=Scytonema hofmannii TaxID=34078 RepID=UPI00034C7F50|nr:hypothetical protein [Scytonema hofmannii]
MLRNFIKSHAFKRGEPYALVASVFLPSLPLLLPQIILTLPLRNICQDFIHCQGVKPLMTLI